MTFEIRWHLRGNLNVMTVKTARSGQSQSLYQNVIRLICDRSANSVARWSTLILTKLFWWIWQTKTEFESFLCQITSQSSLKTTNATEWSISKAWTGGTRLLRCLDHKIGRVHQWRSYYSSLLAGSWLMNRVDMEIDACLVALLVIVSINRYPHPEEILNSSTIPYRKCIFVHFKRVLQWSFLTQLQSAIFSTARISLWNCTKQT